MFCRNFKEGISLQCLRILLSCIILGDPGAASRNEPIFSLQIRSRGRYTPAFTLHHCPRSVLAQRPKPEEAP